MYPMPPIYGDKIRKPGNYREKIPVFIPPDGRSVIVGQETAAKADPALPVEILPEFWFTGKKP